MRGVTARTTVQTGQAGLAVDMGKALYAMRAYLATFVALRPNARRLLLGNLCVQTGVGVSGVLFNLYLVALGHGVGFIGLTSAVSTIGQAAIAPVVGWSMHRFGARVVLVTGAVALALSSALSALVSADAALVALVLLSGLGFAAVTIPAGPYMIGHAAERQRTHLFSAYFASNTVGSMFGSLVSSTAPALTLLLLGVHGQSLLAADRVGLLVGAAIMIPSVWLFWRMRVEAPASEASVERPTAPLPVEVEETSLRGDVTVMLAATGVIALTMGATVPFFNVYFASRLHASTSTIGAIYALSGLVCAVAAVLAPAAGRYGRVRGFNAARALTAPAFLLFCLHPGLGLAAAAYIGRNTIGTISGTLENVFAMEAVPARLRSLVAGWRALVFNAGWSIGSLVAGTIVAHFGYESVFLLSAVITCAGTAAYFVRFARWDRKLGVVR